MATSVTASYTAGDLSQQHLRRPTHHHQSILPLRRERTTIDGELRRNRESKPVYSHEFPVKSTAFSGEKQYDRRQLSTQVRSAKSDEVFRLIDRRLQTGVHGVHHMFRANDPNQEGKLSKEAFRRILMQLCGFINAEEWDKVCKLFHITERDGTITFEEFLSYFPENEKVKRELSLSHSDRRNSSLLTLSQNVTSAQQSHHKRYLPKLTANYCFSLMKTRCRDPAFKPNDYLPYDCLNDGVIVRDHLKKILENFQLDDIIDNESEFEKLWTKFDLDNVSMVRTNVFLRLLDYRVNLADEIDANIQRLVSRSSAAGMIDRRLPSSLSTGASSSSSSSRKQKRLSINKNREYNVDEHNKHPKHIVPPPTALGAPLDETLTNSDLKHINDEHEDSTKISPSMTAAARELSTKFRSLVQQHRKMIKQLNETDEFVPFLDRKVNEGYFCLKTVFSYLDPTHINFISKEQFIAALNQFDIPLTSDNIDQFLQKYHCTSTKVLNNETMIDYKTFLKYFQDRSDSSFLARTLSTFTHNKSIPAKSDLNTIERGIIDLLHHLFLSLTAAFKYISNDIEDLCPEKELFIILRKELGIADNYHFTDKQKTEVYTLLNCNDKMKQEKQLPYKYLLHFLSKITIPIHKERMIEKKMEEQKPFTPPRKSSYIEKTLNDLIRLRMHTFTKVFSRIDQPRTDNISKEQFYDVLQQMGTDLTRSEINMIWASSGFHMEKSIPFPNLIRQLIMFNRDENQFMIHQLQHSQSFHDRLVSTTLRSTMSTSTRDISSSGGISDISSVGQSADYHGIFDRIYPYIRQNYSKIKNELLENDPTACGLIDFSILLDIFHVYSVPINDAELGALVRLDNPRNGSKIQYPFFIRKYHPDGAVIKTSPWSRVHPIYEQLIQKQHAKHPVKEVYDQRTQNPRDLKYLIRLFNSYDKTRKGFLTNDEFYSLLHDNGINLNKSDEDYYQLFSKYDRHLRDQFNYTDLFRTIINTIMS